MQKTPKDTVKMAKARPISALVPKHEWPLERFLGGEAELMNRETRQKFTIWEALLDFPESAFPIQAEGFAFSRKDLMCFAARKLKEDGGACARQWISATDLSLLKYICGIEAHYLT